MLMLVTFFTVVLYIHPTLIRLAFDIRSADLGFILVTIRFIAITFFLWPSWPDLLLAFAYVMEPDRRFIQIWADRIFFFDC